MHPADLHDRGTDALAADLFSPEAEADRQRAIGWESVDTTPEALSFDALAHEMLRALGQPNNRTYRDNLAAALAHDTDDQGGARQFLDRLFGTKEECRMRREFPQYARIADAQFARWDSKREPDSKGRDLLPILKAARRPFPGCCERFALLGTDGNWWYANGFPHGVHAVQPIQRQSRGWVLMDRDGTTYGTAEETEAALRARWEEHEDKKAAEFAAELMRCSDKRFEEQRAYWHRQANPPTPRQNFREAWIDEMATRMMTTREYRAVLPEGSDEDAALETAARLVDKMLPGLETGDSAWDSPTIKAACKRMGIKHGKASLAAWLKANR